MWRIVGLLSVLLALVQTSCTHTLSECAACGPGKVCQRKELPGTSMPAVQCFTPCKSDGDCGSGQTCNCDRDVCSQYTETVPVNVCVVGKKQRRSGEGDEAFTIDPKDRRFCQGCRPGEVCIDIGTGEKPEFRCIKQCARDSDCPAPMLCNCGTEECAMHNAFADSNICLLPPTDANQPKRGSP